MREIKFRLWNPTAKKYWFDYQIGLEEWDEGDTVTDVFYNTGKGYVWEQYTGLKDGNGVEIYEGDVVGYKFKMQNRKPLIKVVEWNNVSAGFIPRNMSEFEVIGNIHQNPELLK